MRFLIEMRFSQLKTSLMDISDLDVPESFQLDVFADYLVSKF